MDYLIRIEQKMYGDYMCSCGRGKPLGNPVIFKNLEKCYGVGDKADEEGYEWRMFTKECWESGIKEHSNEYIFENYPVPPVNESELPI